MGLAAKGELFVAAQFAGRAGNVRPGSPDAVELRLHLAPMLLGGGTPLFRAGMRQRYRQRDVRASSDAAHLTYERLSG